MHRDLDQVLITREQIARRIAGLAEEIRLDLERLGEGAEIVLVPVLTGSIIFIADLMRCLPQKLRIGVVTVTSYPGRSTSSQGAALAGSLPENLEGKHVLIVDDILDSGNTIRLVRERLARRNPASVRVCVLLRKEREAAMAVPCDYIGFDIPDAFVVGYGLDYDDYYRNLPEIGTLRREAM